MVKKLWWHMIEMCRIWFAPKYNIQYATTGRYPCRKPTEGRRGSLSRPLAFLTRRYAAGRGSKDYLVTRRAQLNPHPGTFQASEDLPGSY